MNKLMNVFDWIYRLLYLNALWVLFTLGGLIVLGLFPSTVSMFYIVKEWLGGNKDLPVFKTFLCKYKEGFIRSQLIGLVLVSISFLLYFDIQFFFHKEGTFFYILRYLMVTIGFIFIIMLVFLFPLFVQGKLSIVELFKSLLFISITRIFHSIIMVLGCFTIIVVFSKFAGFFIFFLGSAIAFWLTWNAKIAFQKIQDKAASYQ